MNTQEKWESAKEFAYRLDVSRDTVIRWIKRGYLKAFRFPCPARNRKRTYESYRIRLDDGERFIRSRMTS
jgi:predicted site-specific integrase-resolvase